MAEPRTFATLADRTTALLVNTAIFYLVFVVVAKRWLQQVASKAFGFSARLLFGFSR